MNVWTVHKAADMVAVPWRNGLGTTRDVVTASGPEGALRWQAGIADLVHDAPFSHFPHCDRIFTPIAGDPPPQLSIDGGPFEPCPLLQPKPFPGDVPTLSRIPAPGRAFNAVADRRHHRIAVTVLRLEAGDPMEPPAAAHLVLYCHAGQIALAGARLSAGDCARADGPAPVVTALVDSLVILVAVREAGPAPAPP